VWCPDDDEQPEDGRVFHATDAQYAAEMWAEADDCESAEYRIVAGSEVTVHVCREDDYVAAFADEYDVQRFIVSGESVPQYRAKRLGDG
jgi:hypothetical protein